MFSYKKLLIPSLIFTLGFVIIFIGTSVYTSNRFQVNISSQFARDYPLPNGVVEELNNSANNWGGANPGYGAFTVTHIQLRDNTYMFSVTAGVLDSETGDIDERYRPLNEFESFNVFITQNARGAWVSAPDTDLPKLRTVFDLVSEEALPSVARDELYPDLNQSPIAAFFSPKVKVVAEQTYEDYRMPFPSDTQFEVSQGWENESLEFSVVGGGTSDILAMASGVVSNICQVPGEIQAAIQIETIDTDESFYYAHLDRNTIDFNEIFIGAVVDQGQNLGQMSYDNSYSTCGSTDEANIQLNFPEMEMEIDGIQFTPTETNMGEVLESNNEYCSPPEGEDSIWFILTSCEVTSSRTVDGSIIVGRDSVLTIENNSVLDVDLENKRIDIENGSGILIKDGSKIE